MSPVKRPAIYTVPTSNQQLFSFSNFPLRDVEITPSHLSFKLPTEISSPAVYKVTFERSKEDSNIFNSYFGQAHCLQNTKKTIRCDIQYNSLYQEFLQENLPLTKDFLRVMNISQEKRESLLILAEKFSGDPIGFLTIEI